MFQGQKMSKDPEEMSQEEYTARFIKFTEKLSIPDRYKVSATGLCDRGRAMFAVFQTDPTGHNGFINHIQPAVCERCRAAFLKYFVAVTD